VQKVDESFLSIEITMAKIFDYAMRDNAVIEKKEIGES
jgi:hypothetical protein